MIMAAHSIVKSIRRRLNSEGVRPLAKELIGRSLCWCIFFPRRCSWSSMQNLVYYRELNCSYGLLKKSGNSNIMKIMHLQVTGAHTNDAAIYRRQYRLHNLNKSLLGLAGALKSVKHSFKFTFVRNPYVRCLSMFRDKVERGSNNRYRTVPGFGQRGREGFREFVRFLGDGGTSYDDHFLPQVDSLPFAVSDFDYVGKIESFSDDFLEVLRLANIDYSKEVIDLVKKRANTSHVTYSENYLDDYYDPEIRDMVRRVYRDDFSKLDYADVLSD